MAGPQGHMERLRRESFWGLARDIQVKARLEGLAVYNRSESVPGLLAPNLLAGPNVIRQGS